MDGSFKGQLKQPIGMYHTWVFSWFFPFHPFPFHFLIFFFICLNYTKRKFVEQNIKKAAVGKNDYGILKCS